MPTIIQSLCRDHHDIEQLLRVLEQECDVFGRAEHPDYELLTEVLDHLGSFVEQYHRPRDELLFDLARTANAECAKTVEDIIAERANAGADFQKLGDALREILNEQRVFRQTFEDPARGFIRHQRRQIEIEEQHLFPMAQSALKTADWDSLQVKLRDESLSPRSRRLKQRLRDKRQTIIRAEAADQAERDALRQTGNK